MEKDTAAVDTHKAVYQDKTCIMFSVSAVFRPFMQRPAPFMADAQDHAVVMCCTAMSSISKQDTMCCRALW